MVESVILKQPKKLLSTKDHQVPFGHFFPEKSARDLASNSPWEMYKYWLACLEGFWGWLEAEGISLFLAGSYVIGLLVPISAQKTGKHKPRAGQDRPAGRVKDRCMHTCHLGKNASCLELT